MKKLNQYLNYLILTAVTIFAILYFFNTTSLRTIAPQPTKITDVDQVVNKFLKQTSEQTRKDEIAFKFALEKQMNRPLNIKKENTEKKPEDNSEYFEKAQGDVTNITPSETIQTQIYQKDIEKQQNEISKKEYARQFIENARKSGFHLVLSEDNKVLSVTPIRKPTQSDESTDSFPAD